MRVKGTGPLTPSLTDEMHYYLMVGEWATCGLDGWVAAAQQGLWGNPSIEAVWAAHRVTLEREAKRAGFWAAGPSGPTVPAGPAVERWKARFLAQHAPPEAD